LHKILAALVISSFNAAKVTVLPKPNKIIAQKATPGAWRLISLLNTVGKVVEAAFAQRITDVAKAKYLLSNGQMSNKRGWSTDLAIKMVIKAATEARKSGEIASLLQLDIKKAFDAINH
jgi:retron-type reverse transcriptase